jgi:hypothetical protein
MAGHSASGIDSTEIEMSATQLAVPMLHNREYPYFIRNEKINVESQCASPAPPLYSNSEYGGD